MLMTCPLAAIAGDEHMRNSLKAAVLTVAALAIAVPALSVSAQAETTQHKTAKSAPKVSSKASSHGARLGFAPAHKPHYAALVGDPQSGLGFYDLPLKDRIGAARYHWRNQRPPWANPLRQAVLADSLRSPSNWVPEAQTDYRYGVFSPYDGVGTPFFGGYYSGGSQDHDDGQPFHSLVDGSPIPPFLPTSDD